MLNVVSKFILHFNCKNNRLQKVSIGRDGYLFTFLFIKSFLQSYLKYVFLKQLKQKYIHCLWHQRTCNNSIFILFSSIVSFSQHNAFSNHYYTDYYLHYTWNFVKSEICRTMLEACVLKICNS